MAEDFDHVGEGVALPEFGGVGDAEAVFAAVDHDDGDGAGGGGVEAGLAGGGAHGDAGVKVGDGLDGEEDAGVAMELGEFVFESALGGVVEGAGGVVDVGEGGLSQSGEGESEEEAEEAGGHLDCGLRIAGHAEAQRGGGAEGSERLRRAEGY